ncbi:hypothetical protein SAMD00019534_081300 [Acytostelium subglobosum LB1]|uniref:hypothetical protein n=1 Tax=Acytostelium subglobosum LB1 TaxID=1410327 RepID=UPI000645121A|nr:hypothetical protein SAMD00019534_081300 [Acytostelium subglobosum LB1]GAM24955.1 hypothetical protein SAMD00019534_081300 [Acytostelium subglobosum LB1]|eukprot:XP_012752044.1 hypothetical protein SAMD00019534_081300 [Acytostelium subglobosum LB1]
MDRPRAVISFTGGKDCTLALHRLNDSYDVVALVTFAPSATRDKPFKAHPLTLVAIQAQALGLPHHTVYIDGPNYLDSYRQQITTKLREELIVRYLITGDILDVCNNFMGRAVETTGVELVRPLFELPRQNILDDVFARNFKVIVSCANVTKFGPSFDMSTLVGQQLTPQLIQHLRDLNAERLKQQQVDGDGSGGPSVDLAGEYGEFHTMVLDAPLFKHGSINIGSMVMQRDTDYCYVTFENTTLVTRP